MDADTVDTSQPVEAAPAAAPAIDVGQVLKDVNAYLLNVIPIVLDAPADSFKASLESQEAQVSIAIPLVYLCSL